MATVPDHEASDCSAVGVFIPRAISWCRVGSVRGGLRLEQRHRFCSGVQLLTRRRRRVGRFKSGSSLKFQVTTTMHQVNRSYVLAWNFKIVWLHPSEAVGSPWADEPSSKSETKSCRWTLLHEHTHFSRFSRRNGTPDQDNVAPPPPVLSVGAQTFRSQLILNPHVNPSSGSGAAREAAGASRPRRGAARGSRRSCSRRACGSRHASRRGVSR
jgi:hypothetical protein